MFHSSAVKFEVIQGYRAKMYAYFTCILAVVVLVISNAYCMKNAPYLQQSEFEILELPSSRLAT